MKAVVKSCVTAIALMMGGGGILTPSLHADETTTGTCHEYRADDYAYDVGDYVQDGLVAMYDGIRNDGRDLPHNPNLDGWNNLATNAAGEVTGPHLTFVRQEGDTSRWINNNAYAFNRMSYAKMTDALVYSGGENDNKNFTVQLVLDIDLDVQNVAGSHAYLAENISVGKNIATRKSSQNGKQVFWLSSFGSNGAFADKSTWDGKYITGIVTADKIYLSYEANYGQGNDRAYKGASASGHAWVVGGSTASSNGGYAKGLYHSVRFYNRALTEAELAHNRMVDEARFRMKPNVLVQTSVPGVEAKEKSGRYRVEGVYEFKAEPVRVANRIYAPSGYTVEVWDATSGAWGAAEIVTFDGTGETAYTYDASNAQNVRLTWQWELAGGLRTATGDVDDYVRNGLVAHYDGIRNAGRKSDHNPSATVWTNLVENGPHLDFTLKTDAADTDEIGGWSNDGTAYEFKGASYARMNRVLAGDLPPFGTDGARKEIEMTFEAALAIDIAAQGATTRSYLTANVDTSDVGMYTRSSGSYKQIAWFLPFARPNGFTGGSSWDGKYITGIVTADKAYLSYDTTYGSSIDRNTYLAGISYQWAIGGSNKNGCSIGLYHSIRFYNRALSEAELVWNREIDEIRFRGAAATTNVIVATTLAGAEGNELSGAYFVKGTWTFTAPEKVVVDGENVPLTGWKAETLNADGSVLSKRTGEGGSFPYNAATDGLVRLTWRYGGKGLCIIIR